MAGAAARAAAPGIRAGRRRGMTLVELIITMAAMATLASLAFPAYQAQVNRSRVSQAIADIKLIEMKLERFFTDRGRFPATLPEARLNLVDPWGNPYRYLNMDGASVGQVRKDHSLHPLNTDYDLYSMGPDGDSVSPLTARKSRDDIIRARNGTFVGPASDY